MVGGKKEYDEQGIRVHVENQAHCAILLEE